jgi:cystathionine beta-lyase family protein involved in aluminum resistance
LPGEIEGSIFGAPQPSKLIQMPWLVTVQFQFKIDGHTKQGVELAIMKGINVGALLAPSMLSYGVDGVQLTEQMLKEMGVDLSRKS